MWLGEKQRKLWKETLSKLLIEKWKNEIELVIYSVYTYYYGNFEPKGKSVKEQV